MPARPASRDALSCWEPLAILPHQWRGVAWWRPEHDLLADVLLSAIHDLDTARRLRRETWPSQGARAWLDGAQAPFRFLDVCHGLRLDAPTVRRCILERFP